MATLVFFHAHPDDEAIATAGSMAMYADAGHRVVLVLATGGEHGEVPDDLAPGESLADRRRAEAERSAARIGVARVAWLGYEDSGMEGWEQNANHNSFHQAHVDTAAQKLADLLTEEGAHLLTVYDWHGNYGHPDHVQVHRVGHRAAELAGTPEVYEATINRDHLATLIEAARASGMEVDPPGDDANGNAFGMAERDLTTAIDIRAFIARKRAALAEHRSQVSDSSFFLQMPDEVFALSFGTEWYIRKGAPSGIHEDRFAGIEV